MLNALAIARPVQWVASPGGSEQVNSSTFATVLAESGALPGLRVLSRKSPSTPCSPYLCCQRHTAGRLSAGSARHFEDRQAFGGRQDDLRPLDMLQRTVAVADNGEQSLAIFGRDDDIDGLGHAARFAHPAPDVNLM